MRKSLLLGSLAALGCTAPALAEGLSYTYVEASYVATEVDDLDIDGDGIGLFGSIALGKTFYAFASYADSDYDLDIGSQMLELGVGAHWPLSSKVDIITAAAFIDTNIDVAQFGGFSDEGYLLATGLRIALDPRWELHGAIEYVDIGGTDDTSFDIGARFYLTQHLALGADYGHNGDGDNWGVALRYDFGRKAR